MRQLVASAMIPGPEELQYRQAARVEAHDKKEADKKQSKKQEKKEPETKQKKKYLFVAGAHSELIE